MKTLLAALSLELLCAGVALIASPFPAWGQTISAHGLGTATNPVRARQVIPLNAQTCHQPAANTIATVSIVAAAGSVPVLTDLTASYTSAPASNYSVTVTRSSGPATVWIGPVLQPGSATQWIYEHQWGAGGLVAGDGETLTASLPAGGAGISGRVCVTGSSVIW
jgi:hypothetical protein